MHKQTASRSFPQCARREHGEWTDGHAAMEEGGCPTRSLSGTEHLGSENRQPSARVRAVPPADELTRMERTATGRDLALRRAPRSSVRAGLGPALSDSVGTLGTSPRFTLLTLHEADSSMHGYGNSDGTGFPASQDEFVWRTGASLTNVQHWGWRGVTPPRFEPQEARAPAKFAGGGPPPSRRVLMADHRTVAAAPRHRLGPGGRRTPPRARDATYHDATANGPVSFIPRAAHGSVRCPERLPSPDPSTVARRLAAGAGSPLFAPARFPSLPPDPHPRTASMCSVSSPSQEDRSPWCHLAVWSSLASISAWCRMRAP